MNRLGEPEALTTLAGLAAGSVSEETSMGIPIPGSDDAKKRRESPMRCEICVHDTEPHTTGPAGAGVGAYCTACPECEREIAAWSAFASSITDDRWTAPGRLVGHQRHRGKNRTPRVLKEKHPTPAFSIRRFT